jgi:hypothetical protein
MSETILWVLIVVNAAGIAMSIRTNRSLNASKRIYEELADECDAQLATLRETNDRAEAQLRKHYPWALDEHDEDVLRLLADDWHDDDIKPSDDR